MCVQISWVDISLKCDRIDASEGIDVDKTGGFSGCFICQYWFFFRINFRFQPKGCDSFHGMKQKSVSFDHVAIVTVERGYYRISFWDIT